MAVLGKAGVPCNGLGSGLVAMGVNEEPAAAESLFFLDTGATSAPNPLALPEARVPFFLDMYRSVTDADDDDDDDMERPGRGGLGWNALVLLLATTNTKSSAPIEDFIFT
jgi:hypothetical protein